MIKNLVIRFLEAAVRSCSSKFVLLKMLQTPQENTCAGTLFLIKLQASSLQLCQKQAPAQMFSYGFWKIFNNTNFAEHLRTAGSSFLAVSKLVRMLKVSA